MRNHIGLLKSLAANRGNSCILNFNKGYIIKENIFFIFLDTSYADGLGVVYNVLE